MQAILDQLEAISPMLPSLVRGIIILAAIILAWVLVSIPAYWIARALASPLGRLSETFGRIRSRMMEFVRTLFGRRGVPVEQFVADHAQAFSFAADNAKILSELRAARGTVQAMPTKWSGLETAVLDAQKATKDTGVAIQRLQWPEPVEPPSPTQYAAIRVERNDAWLRVVTFGLFALALIGINTLMLKEFFASFVPPIRILGAPLPIVMSCLFSVMEVAFGAFLAFVEGTSTGAYLGKAIGGLAILSLSALELGFYARFGAEFDFDPFSTLWAPDRPPNWTKSWFGIFGPLVVIGMALCGHMLFGALRVLWRDSAVRQFRKFLDARTRSADEIQAKLASAQKAALELSGTLKEIGTQFRPASDALSSGAQQIVEAQRRMDASLHEAQRIRLESHKEVGRAEMLRTFYSCVFQALSAFLAFLVIALAFGAFGFSTPIEIRDVVLPGGLVAFGETAFALGVGLVTGRIVARSAPIDQSQAHLVANLAGDVLAYAAALAVVTANGLAFLNRGSFIDLMWFAFTCAAVIWLLVVGRRLGLVIAAMWAFFQAGAVAVACAAVYAAAAILLLGKVIADLILAILWMVAFPFVALFRRGASSSNPPFTAAEQVSGLWLLLTAGALATLSAASAAAQQMPQEPRSSVTVLVDLSSTWLHPASRSENERVLKAVGDAIGMLATDLDPPIAVRYLPIGDMSLARAALCEVVFTPKLLQVKEAQRKEVTNLKGLEEYLNKSCPQYILSRKPEKFTDISSAFDSAGRATEEQAGPFRAIIVLSDLKEERRPKQQAPKLRLQGARSLLLYRVLDEDRLNPAELDTRLEGWKARLADAGSKVSAISDLSASPGQISRVLQQ
jgi:hypothetical protein